MYTEGVEFYMCRYYASLFQPEHRAIHSTNQRLSAMLVITKILNNFQWVGRTIGKQQNPRWNSNTEVTSSTVPTTIDCCAYEKVISFTFDPSY